MNLGKGANERRRLKEVKWGRITGHNCCSEENGTYLRQGPPVYFGGKIQEGGGYNGGAPTIRSRKSPKKKGDKRNPLSKKKRLEGRRKYKYCLILRSVSVGEGGLVPKGKSENSEERDGRWVPPAQKRAP